LLLTGIVLICSSLCNSTERLLDEDPGFLWSVKLKIAIKILFSSTGDDHLEHFENSICQDIGTTFKHTVKNSAITRKKFTQNKMIHKFPCILLNVYRWYPDAGKKKIAFGNILSHNCRNP